MSLTHKEQTDIINYVCLFLNRNKFLYGICKIQLHQHLMYAVLCDYINT